MKNYSNKLFPSILLAMVSGCAWVCASVHLKVQICLLFFLDSAVRLFFYCLRIWIEQENRIQNKQTSQTINIFQWTDQNTLFRMARKPKPIECKWNMVG